MDAIERDRIADAVSRLIPEPVRPWSITVHRHSHVGGWSVQLEHEASHGLGFDAGDQFADTDSAIEWFRNCLGHSDRELRRIASAPALEHPDQVLEIRALAHIFDWSKLEVQSVVRFVQRWTLSEAEAEWLVASIGRDPDPPRPSTDF